MSRFYVHHKYTNENFWYFFHGTDVVKEDVPAYYYSEKHTHFEIVTTYKNKEIEIIFCDEDNWDKLDGYHIFDTHLYCMEKGLSTDRGWNTVPFTYIITTLRDELIQKSKKLKELLHIFFIDWEGNIHKDEMRKITESILFVDEIYPNRKIKSNTFGYEVYAFTQFFQSFIHSSNLGIKEFYHFSKFLENHKPEHKLNYSIRRLTNFKLRNLYELHKCKDIYFTHSSYNFTEDSVDATIENEIWQFRKKLEHKSNYIDKRGIGVNDWGNEKNWNNIKELQYKILPLAEVEILDEWMHLNMITEKTVIRILSEKPFIPIDYDVFKYYDTIFKQYDVISPPISFKYNNVEELRILIESKLKSEESWNQFRSELKNWVVQARKSIFEIINNNNSYLDTILFGEINPLKDKKLL